VISDGEGEMEVRAKDLIELLDLVSEYKEFKKVMDKAITRFISLGYDEEILLSFIRSYCKREKKFFTLIFLDAYEEGGNENFRISS
jgi:hypothetical protein